MKSRILKEIEDQAVLDQISGGAKVCWYRGGKDKVCVEESDDKA